MEPRQVVERPVRFGIAELMPDRERPDGWTVAVDGVLQSYVDLADPRYLKIHCMSWMAQVIDRHWPPGSAVSAVLLGGGGFTLPRYLAATRPGSEQTVFELDDQLLKLVRDHLDLDSVPGLRVRVEDGGSGLAGLPDASADLVVLDAFRGGEVAADMVSVEFLRQVARVLRPGGLHTANMWDDADLGFALRAAASAEVVFPHVVVIAEAGVLARSRPGNIVLAASTRELPLEELTRWATTAPTRVFCFTPTQLAAACGTATPVTETDPLTTPVPAVRRWGRGSRFTT